MSSATEGVSLFASYATDPYSWWPEGTDRQAEKLASRIAQLGEKRGVSATVLLEELAAAATIRQRTRRPTVYLCNVGSSGSHWFESLLMAGGGMLGGGEVYLSRMLKERLVAMPSRAQAVFIDALHLLHARATPEESLTANVVNSCHSAGIRHFTRSEPECVRVLLLRDPLEVTLSRTFRKNEYRKAVASGQDDRRYLCTNVSYVSKFMQWAASQQFDVTVRYEDLRVDPRSAVSATCSAAGAPLDIARLERAIERHDAARISQSGAISGSNLFLGTRDAVPENLMALAESELAELRRHFGYS